MVVRACVCGDDEKNPFLFVLPVRDAGSLGV